MAEGTDGAMWFGVTDGVMRYDGEHWRLFTPADGLVGTSPNTLYCAPTGEVYAGTATGLSRFAAGRWERVFPTKPDQEAAIFSVVIAKDGSLWAASTGFIFQAKGNEFTIFALAEQQESVRATFPDARHFVIPCALAASGANNNRRDLVIYETRDGMIWCGKFSGEVFRHDPRNPQRDAASAWRLFTAADGYIQGYLLKAIFQTSDGLLWVGGGQPNNVINRYDSTKDAWSHFDLNDLLNVDNLVHSIIQTRDGSIWFGGLSRVSRYKDGQWRAYSAPNVPLSTSKVDLHESRSGILYLLGLGDDVQTLDYQGARWRKYEGLNYQCETPDGRQWFIAQDDGVVCFDGQNWQRYGVEDGLMSSPYALLCTRQGQLWAAGVHERKAAAAWLTGAQWHRRSLTGMNPEFGDIIDYRALFESADGRLWFGTYVNGRAVNGTNGGILQYDPRKGPPEDTSAWQNSRAFYGACSNGIAETADGALYSGNFSGLFRFDGTAWNNAPLLPKPIGAVDALANSADGKLWVGTRGEGLLLFDGKHVSRFTTKEGLRADSITALFCDRDNHLWVGTSKGISHFDGTEWTTDAFLDAKITLGFEGGGFKQSADGALWINQCSRTWLRRVLPDSKRGLSSFSTVRYQRERVAPRAEIVAGLAKVSQPGNTLIAWRGIDPWRFSKASDLMYSYRLDGAPWTRFSSETNHIFLELPKGPHRFEVRVRDRDLNVSKEPAFVDFTVLPPVWQEPWALALLAFLGGVIGIQTARVFRRERRLRQSNLALEDKTERLEQEIEERKRMEQEIERTHKQLLLASRQAGMAEVATSVLHNVGNVLNSVNVSATLVCDKVKQMKLLNLTKVADLLQEKATTPDFLTNDAKGKQVPGFLRTLGGHLVNTQEESLKELELLRQNIDHIKDIVTMQQTYSRMAGVTETLKVSDMVEDAIRMNAGALTRHDVKLERDFRDDPTIEIEKHKVLQILVNLIRNAKYACDESGRTEKNMLLRIVRSGPERVQILVIDNGVGIPPENMTLIFNHGFTTRKDGHGYGLHSAANAARELGGSLVAQSDGPGRGATFTLELPFHPAATDRQAYVT